MGRQLASLREAPDPTKGGGPEQKVERIEPEDVFLGTSEFGV